MEGVRLLICDLDATLRRCTVLDQPCPHRPGEWELLPWVSSRLEQIDWGAVAFGAASNQAGVALGYLSDSMAHQLAYDAVSRALGPRAMLQLSIERKGPYIWICPHAPDAGCRCRKPLPGMLLSIMEFAGIPAAGTLYVGDLETDEMAARAAGCTFAWAWDFFGATKEEWIDWLAMRAKNSMPSGS